MKTCDILPDWPSGLKKTHPRECVLRILRQAQTPLTALDIHGLLEKQGETIWLSTVYRVLDCFAERNIVRKVAVLDNGMAVYELSRSTHTHYAVCISCHKIIPFENCPMGAFVPKLSDSGFHVLGHKVEMFGYCKNCDPDRPKGK